MVEVLEGVGHVWEVCGILEQELSEYASFLEVIQLASIVIETTKSVDYQEIIIRELFVVVFWSFAIVEIHLTHLRYADDRCYLDESLFFRTTVVYGLGLLAFGIEDVFCAEVCYEKRSCRRRGRYQAFMANGYLTAFSHGPQSA